MNCQDARAYLLAGETTDKVESHLEGCVECRRATADIERARSDLQSESMWAEPPPGLENTIVSSITGRISSSPTSTLDTDEDESRSHPLWVAVMFGSVAAAAILVVGVVALMSRADGPDWEATMIGTDARPVASAIVAGWNTDAGTRVVLEVSDLGPAPEGFVYQLWFSSGSHDVSAGTFSDPGHVELTVGIARRDYPTVWLALEPIAVDGGDTGPALLVSTDS